MNCTLCMNGLKHEESLKKKIFFDNKINGDVGDGSGSRGFAHA